MHGTGRDAAAAGVAVRGERRQPPHAHVHLPLELHHLLRSGLQVSRKHGREQGLTPAQEDVRREGAHGQDYAKLIF